MAMRFSVQTDTREECVQGLDLFRAAGLEVVRPPTQVIGNGWLGRAVPRPATADEPVDVEVRQPS